MHDFAEDYVAKLPTREERYETRLGDDFYVSTFPNGVKTWIYLFEVNGYTRRQTLGVYPETRLEVALEALYNARRTRAVEQELMEQGLDGNSLVRVAADSRIDLATQPKTAWSLIPDRQFLAGAGAGVLVASVAAIMLWQFTGLTITSDVAAQPHTNATMASISQPTANTQSPGPVDVSVAGAKVDVRKPEVAQFATATPPSINAATGSESGSIAPTVELLADELGDSQRAVRALQRDMTGTLAWAQLTSGIFGGAPVDDLGWIVELEHGPKRVFYFVRVRGMAGVKVVYRWSHEGETLKEEAVAVGTGWHSPAFSSMTLTPDRTGAWRVEVFSSSGDSLGVEEFEARVSPKLAVNKN